MTIISRMYGDSNFFNYFDDSIVNPDLVNMPINRQSTSTRIISDFIFDGPSVHFEINGVFQLGDALNLSQLLANDPNPIVTSTSVSFDGTLSETHEYTNGVDWDTWWNAFTVKGKFETMFSGNDFYYGSLSNAQTSSDTYNGYAGNDTFYGYGSFRWNDSFDGGSGIDTAVYRGIYSDYKISKSKALWNPVTNRLDLNGFIVSDKYSNRDLIDELTNVERLQFSNKKIALDLTADGNAGKTLEFIGMLAHGMVNTPAVIGTILSIFDQGKSMQEVCQLAIDVGLTGQLAGSTSNLDLAKLVFRNVVGSEASAGDAANLASYIQGNGGSMTQADFLATVAQLDLNNQHIGLVGLQSTGVEYSI